MNINDIIKAINSNEITISEVEHACEIVRNYIDASNANLELATIIKKQMEDLTKGKPI